MVKDLILVRGLPGSGKSTFAKKISEYYVEADMYHYDENGKYDWKIENLYASHKWCEEQCEIWMQRGKEKIAVSNTFTTEKEMKNYFNLAEKYGYRVTTIVVENRHGGVNIHDVPQETISKMENRFNIKLI